MSIVEVLDDCKNYFSNEELLDTLEEFDNPEAGNVSQLSSHHFKSILRELQDAYLYTKKCDRVALLELMYRGF
jgi:hypothetical protein